MKYNLKNIKEKRISNKGDFKYGSSDVNKIYLTIADSDFETSEAILNDVSNKVKDGNIAYGTFGGKLYQSVQKWYKENFDVAIERNEMIFVDGVMNGIKVVINSLSNEGDGIIINPPVYTSFNDAIKATNRKIINSNLHFKGNRWAIDFNDLEEKMKNAKMYILCSPHNPTGTIWTKEEIKKIIELAEKHNVIIISDEVWQDIIIEGKLYHTLNENSKNLIHLSSPAKTFNLSSIHSAHIITRNEDFLQKIYQKRVDIQGHPIVQPWIEAAVTSSYSNPENKVWKNNYVAFLKENINNFTQFLIDQNFEYSKIEGTYLIFFKLGNSKINGAKMKEIVSEMGLVLNDGSSFGDEFKEWVRLSISVDKETIEKAKQIILNFKEKYN